MERLTKEFATSLITVILAILAIAIFISSGGGMLFYVAVAIAILFGFYNAWLISTAKPGKAAPETRPKRKRRGKYS
ncbi:MAG: hypothetical protein KGI06_03375 [Candidatus Micrarchaeota archaeon]|nr:hypothetical protein [Candidatus Micrarchaeota archaeon]